VPSIFWLGGLRVVIYPNDHVPEHVHVVGADCEAVFESHCPVGPVTLRESYGFRIRKLRAVAEALNVRLFELCDAWRVIHDSE
jgi:hypothetical protein